MASTAANKRPRKGFGRSLRTMLKKADHLHVWGAEVYLVVYYRGRYYGYSSKQNAAWPPSRDEIVSAVYPLKRRKLALTDVRAVGKARSFPVPVRKYPSDYTDDTDGHDGRNEPTLTD
ncbi:hypothetical protein MMC13_007428 [Lambiella insularis]|nr:hypothetical protein [Lambiella insularis]